MEKLTLHKESCKSCQYCINICPKDAISLSSYMNSKGYQTIKVDEEKCVKCGSCYVMCPEYVFEIEEV